MKYHDPTLAYDMMIIFLITGYFAVHRSRDISWFHFMTSFWRQRARAICRHKIRDDGRTVELFGVAATSPTNLMMS